MRNGISVSQAEKIISFFSDVQRRQRIAVFGAVGLAVVVFAGYLFWPTEAQTGPAVFWIQPSGSAGGAAFLVTGRLVLTTAQVVGRQADVSLTYRDQAAVRGRVLFTDTTTDVALVEIQDLDPSLTPLPLGNSDSLVDGEDVILLGYPSGMPFETRARLTRSAPEELKIAAPAHPGNSGGPVLRASDRTVVGLIGSTRELGSSKDTNMHWAVPINVIKKICRQRQRPVD